MRVFEAGTIDGYEFCVTPRHIAEDDPKAWSDGMRLTEGGREGGPTEMPMVEILVVEGRRRYRRADGMSIGPALVLRPEAADALRVKCGVSVLDVPTTDGTLLKLLRVPVIPGLDTVTSRIRWLERGVRAMMVDRAVFFKGVIGVHAAFAVPETNRTYLTERFVDVWRAHRFEGLEFDLLWEAE